MKFSDLGLCDEILRALNESGYETPTPIQAEAIPIALMGRDILGCAQTGTGKTASFTLPMIEALSTGRSRARMPRALILEPTRELAAQVAENFEKYGKYHKLSHALLIGGEFMGEQMKTLTRGVDVLIATPGRLIDMFERGKVMLNDVKIFVIDEADRMLDMGFIPDVEKIASRLTPVRQTMLYSATMPPEIRRLAEQFLMNPKEISVAPPASPAETVAQKKILTNRRAKNSVLSKVMRGEDINNAIIFCNRKRDVDSLLKYLVGRGFNAAALHGDMVQFKRMETLARFKAGEVMILVASDVAARGLDIVTVSHVFNYDVPIHADDYIHRIGRTGRAGRSGKSFTLVTSEDDKYIGAIEKLIGMSIPVFDAEGASPAPAEPAVGDADSAPEERKRTRRRRSSRGEKQQADTNVDAAVDATPEAGAKADANADVKADAKVDAKADAKPDAKPDIKAAEKAPAKADAPAKRKRTAKPKTKAKAKTDAKTEAEIDAKADVKADAKTEEPAAKKPRTRRKAAEKQEKQPYNPNATEKPAPQRRGRKDNKSDFSGAIAFTDDDTPAFLLRPARKATAS